MKNKSVNPKFTMNKHDFLEFLASATPEEINNYIQEKGKPMKLFCPIFYYTNPNNPKEETNNEYC